MSAPAQSAAKPTIVLVHGAFADSSSWNAVIARLHRDGFTVIAPANPLRDLHADARYLRSVIDSVDGPIVLAGHSYGGSVLSEAADGADQVRALVYIASFLLEVGESTAELAGKYPGGELGPALNPVPFSTGAIPSWTLITTQDLNIPAESMRFMAARANSTIVEIDASHAVAVSRPDAVADLIRQAARETSREAVGARSTE